MQCDTHVESHSLSNEQSQQSFQFMDQYLQVALKQQETHALIIVSFFLTVT